MRTPIRYAGGKSKAYKLITPFITADTIVSPFIGGGSMEVRWATELDKEILGADVMQPLVNFWQVLTRQPQDLANFLLTLEPTKDEYSIIKEILMCWDVTQDMLSSWHTDYYKREPISLDPLTAAGYYFYNHNLSYGPMYLGWISKIYQDRGKWERLCKRIADFSAPNFSVIEQQFADTISNAGSEFLYLDPPYFLEKDGDNKMFKGIYPNANVDVHHSGFDHELLRDLLHSHPGKFVLSYNNCETIREYYSDFELIYPEWHYSYALGETRIGKNKESNTPKESHEILIVKH